MVADPYIIALPDTVADEFELHPLSIRDSTELFVIIDRDRDYLAQWQNWPDTIRSVRDMRRLIYYSQQKTVQSNGFDMSIWRRGRIAGKIGLVYIDWGARRTEFGYWLAKPFQGRGLVTQACHVLLNHTFNSLNLRRVDIRCALGNARSRAIPQRLGFQYRGVIPHPVMIRGMLHKEGLYTMTAGQWRQQQTIYHITTRAEWLSAQETGEYRAPSLATQGFIHLSGKGQIIKVANAVYVGQTDLIILCVDSTLVQSVLKYEPPDTSVPAAHENEELFPHLYSPIPVSAVIRAVDFPPEPDGTFTLPRNLDG
jgi:ribosomal-protein-serine acetyltransferase